MKDERLPENAAAMGEILREGLLRIQAKHPVIGEVRGLGLMQATEFVNPDGSPNPAAVAHVIQRCQDERLLLLNCGTWDQAIRVVPPLVVNKAQIEQFLEIFERAVASI
jgi:4-aminobutyrate aminotransferase